jgi:hypothetical protein
LSWIPTNLATNFYFLVHSSAWLIFHCFCPRYEDTIGDSQLYQIFPIGILVSGCCSICT